MTVIDISSSQHAQLIDITAEVERLIPGDIPEGVCILFTRHTTCALTINENCDPAVKHDLLAALEKLVPWDQDCFTHNEGNSAAHLKSSLLGFSQTIPFREGHLELGRWQGIYFAEFDGPRSGRQVSVQFIASK